jgi:precorrin-2/cobalt-factor-2 C20-methyltransferase
MALGRFYGIGLGPGNPELLTLKARKVLEEVEVVCAPRSRKGRRSIALQMVKPLIGNKEIITPLFPMRKDPEVLRPYWEKAVESIYEKLCEGKDVAFVTIGDPTFYSTYTCIMETIRERYPEVEIETVPGVASLLACFAGLNLSLVDRDEKLAVLPAEYGLEGLDELSKVFDTIVLMKVSRSFKKIVEKLDRLGLKKDAIFVSKCGTRGFFSSPLHKLKGKKADFLSMIIIKGKKK